MFLISRDRKNERVKLSDWVEKNRDPSASRRSINSGLIVPVATICPESLINVDFIGFAFRVDVRAPDCPQNRHQRVWEPIWGQLVDRSRHCSVGRIEYRLHPVGQSIVSDLNNCVPSVCNSISRQVFVTVLSSLGIY